MIVTKLEPVTKAKFKVYLNEQFAFVLYKSELSRYKIWEECEVTQELVDRIKEEVLIKRAKLRAMYLLNHRDRTEQELYNRLKQDLYTEEIIEIAMKYVASFGYIGDDGYARRFVSGKQGTKSKKEIMVMLQQKGISRDAAKNALDECYEEMTEIGAIQRLVEKKHFDKDSASDKEKKKMFDYLLRRGFSYEDIRQVIQVSSWNA